MLQNTEQTYEYSVFFRKSRYCLKFHVKIKEFFTRFGWLVEIEKIKDRKFKNFNRSHNMISKKFQNLARFS